jgi:hypothetical protein
VLIASRDIVGAWQTLPPLYNNGLVGQDIVVGDGGVGIKYCTCLIRTIFLLSKPIVQGTQLHLPRHAQTVLEVESQSANAAQMFVCKSGNAVIRPVTQGSS